MGETGIEDLLEGNGDNGGCVGPLVAALVMAVLLMVAIGLISSYCSPAKNDAPAGNASQPSPTKAV